MSWGLHVSEQICLLASSKILKKSNVLQFGASIRVSSIHVITTFTNFKKILLLLVKSGECHQILFFLNYNRVNPSRFPSNTSVSPNRVHAATSMVTEIIILAEHEYRLQYTK